MGQMHQQFTVGQRAGLLRDAFTTRRNHITDGTRAGYERKALMLFDFCDRMRLPRQFRYQQMAAFFQWYCGSLDLANTSLQGFLSAWRSFSDERGEFFPGSDSREFQRIRQFIRGAQVRYPHEVRRDTPLTLSILSYVAEALGITKLADYKNCPPSTLIFMARILTAHHAMMRSMEHADGCMFGDVTLVNAPSGLIEYIIFRVGQAASARKIKRRPARLTIVPCEDHHMSAGSVLHMAISIKRPRAAALLTFSSWTTFTAFNLLMWHLGKNTKIDYVVSCAEFRRQSTLLWTASADQVCARAAPPTGSKRVHPANGSCCRAAGYPMLSTFTTGRHPHLASLKWPTSS
jgi:hypothetical protein